MSLIFRSLKFTMITAVTLYLNISFWLMDWLSSLSDSILSNTNYYIREENITIFDLIKANKVANILNVFISLSGNFLLMLQFSVVGVRSQCS